MRVFRRRVAALLPAVLVAALLSVSSHPSAAFASGGPSVTPPDTRSTPVQQQAMSPRPADDASTSELHGDQKPVSAPDGAGHYDATPLAPSSTWQVTPQTGDFTWSYPLRVPPAPGGLAPSLALSYASSSVDGRTSSTNNQASWVGDGWDLSVGFVERSYDGCADDTSGGTTPPKTGDLCWRSDNATAYFNGGGGMLIRDDKTGGWRFKEDNGDRIEQLFGAANGDDNGEYWKITTVDGTEYYFGSRADAHSTWTVPVFGDDAGEPCHADTFDASHCVQGWRWNLDKVVDRNGNEILYGYDTETNSYGMDLKDTAVSYIRGGTLRTVDYGMQDGQQPSAHVSFDVTDRCVPGSTCDQGHPQNWPDVPWDANCTGTTCPDLYSPTFWSTKRLAKITTQVRESTGLTDVDSWTLDQEFPDPGDGEKASLWLKSVTHTGLLGGSVVLPAVTFEGTKMPNRVYTVGDGLAPLNRYRLTGVVSESGGVLSIAYAPPDCVPGRSMPASADTNTLRCFPVRWNKKDYAERTDYFQKYVVASVAQSDRIGSSLAQVTSYQYLDGAAWHYDTSELTPENKKTWNEFRGFGRVVTRTGSADDPAGPVSKVEQLFYRGMNGDKTPTGTRTVNVTPTDGAARADDDWLQGFPLETITYQGDTDDVVDKTINDPAVQGPTATRGAYKAYQVRTGAAQTYTTLRAGGWRSTRTETSYDGAGLPTQVNDLGDTATASDDRCTRTSYSRNSDLWLIDFPSQVETVGVDCAQQASFPRDAVSGVRTTYDDRGNPTQVAELEEYPASGAVYTTTLTADYDALGRAVKNVDALGRTSTVAYTPTTGGPVTGVVETDPNGFAITTTLEPAWGAETLQVDANGLKTETAYDALGRTTGVWLPNRSRSSYPNDGNAKFSYAVNRDAPTVVTSSKLGPKGNYVTTKSVYDGLLRLRQTQQPAVGGGRLLTDTRYDSQGRAYQSTQPYFNDAPLDDNLWVAADVDIPGLTVTKYDGAGREVAESYEASGTTRWVTATSYGGDRVDVTPPAGGTPTTTISDARGQETELRQYHGSTPTGDYDATKYAYTDAGKLASIVDAAGNTWSYTYDLRGRTVSATDPDSGTTASGYDAAGQLTRTTDARGVTLTYDYDKLGRKTAERSGQTTLAAWTYDTAVNGKGQLASSTRYVNGNAYTKKVTNYTTLYQPLQTTVTIPEIEQTLSGTYTTIDQYNVDGSTAATNFPALGDLAAERVTWTYDDLAHPLTLSGALTGSGSTVDYVTESDYTRYGEPQEVQLGDTGTRVWQTYVYDDSTRRLTRSLVDAEVPHPMQADVHYTYDDSGNVTSIANTPQDQAADTQCFRYDYLRRLTEAWTPGTGCGTAPSAGALAGPAPYWQSLTYDPTGNRRTETEHATGGDTTSAYAYADTGHALESVTTTKPDGSSTSDTYGYDPSGNTTSRKLAGDDQALTWDAEGHLATVTDGGGTTEFVYDADGNPLIRRDPSAITLYLDGQELRLDRDTGGKTGTRYYTEGDTTVAMRDAGGLSWLAVDRQGTAQIAINAKTLQVTQRRMTPFGEPRGGAVSFTGQKGFVGGTINGSIGLTTLGARQYDPSTGRFMSVDPLLKAGDPQQMNGYAYADDSPATLSDPTGLSPEDNPGWCVGWRGDCGIDPNVGNNINGYQTPQQLADKGVLRSQTGGGTHYANGTVYRQRNGVPSVNNVPVRRSPQEVAALAAKADAALPNFRKQHYLHPGEALDPLNTVLLLEDICFGRNGVDCDEDLRGQLLRLEIRYMLDQNPGIIVGSDAGRVGGGESGSSGGRSAPDEAASLDVAPEAKSNGTVQATRGRPVVIDGTTVRGDATIVDGTIVNGDVHGNVVMAHGGTINGNVYGNVVQLGGTINGNVYGNVVQARTVSGTIEFR